MNRPEPATASLVASIVGIHFAAAAYLAQLGLFSFVDAAFWPRTPYARALAHPKVGKAVKARLREMYRTLDPVALLAEVRAAQAELGTRVDGRAGKITAAARAPAPSAADVATFAKGLGEAVQAGEQRVIHRRMHKPYKTRVRMPSMLDPHIEDIERWLEAEPRLTAFVILGRLAERCPGQFGPRLEHR